MTIGELQSFANARDREKIDFWYIARWMVFWIVGSRLKRPKPMQYYLDIEKLTRKKPKKKTPETKITIEKQIEAWEKIDRFKGRKSPDYRKLMKLDK
tara:strand:- start:4618 stop:4908 length:291 start_codon:yes stop_codon:yes gene_type:complete